MAKGKSFTDREKIAIEKQGLRWQFWTLLQRCQSQIIIKNCYTGEVRVIDIGKIPS